MRISTKSRYGLSSMLYMAQNSKAKDYITIQTLSEKLDISRIYLEQVFALLKRAELVISAKGSQGGYQLSRPAKDITVYDVLLATEVSLFEKSSIDEISEDKYVERTIQTAIFAKLDKTLEDILTGVTLQDLLIELEKQTSKDGYMYQI